MDGQLATILAAGIAASVTLAGAVIAYRAGRRQVRDQGEIAHSQWLRTQREQAYVEYLTTCEVANDAIYKCSIKFDEVLAQISSPDFAGNRSEAASSIEIDQAHNLVDAVQHPLNRIIMLGPHSVAEQAEKVKWKLWGYADATESIVRRLRLETPSQRDVDLAGEKMNDVFIGREIFTKMASQVLTGQTSDRRRT
ncbi:hypothetical protein [Streptomyces sp. NPDC048560]|uniref:hypothetical protein n=1 Tax=Streptomyces sp. NPDC048560 TaxID=3155488 RepID=UPI003412FF6B